MRPTVLLFQTNPQKTLSVRILAQKLGLRVLAAAPAQLDLPLADILEQTPGEGSGEPLPGEMLVMAGLNGKITDLFLQGLRRAHAGNRSLQLFYAVNDFIIFHLIAHSFIPTLP